MNTEQIARVAHEVNRAYCQALGDESQPAWKDAPEWQRNSALLGVKLHVGNPQAGPQASHDSWMAQKLAEGWVYGPEKNPDLKQHHCLVAFDQLPVAQQAKDYIFRSVVHALAHGPVDLHAPKFGLDDVVVIKVSDEVGDVIGRAEYSTSEPTYCVRYKTRQGEATEQWWAESALRPHTAVGT